MAEILFLHGESCPRNAPVLNSLSRSGLDMLVLYHAIEDWRGWGRLRLDHPHEVIPPGRLRARLHIARRIMAPGVRVLCCSGYNPRGFVLAALLARLRGIRVVVRTDSNWLREAQRPRWRIRAKALVLRLIYGQRTRVWTSGRNNDRFWREAGLRNRYLIMHRLAVPPVGTPAQGAAFRARHRLGTGMVVLHVGALEPHKGIDTLLAAFRGLPEPTARLVIVGKGSREPEVVRAAAHDGRIRFCGTVPQPEMGAVYAASDLLVLASTFDAWGHAVEEALANGVRVAVTDVVGCAADLVDATNGWQFPVGSVDALTAILSSASAAHARGWPALTPLPPYDGAPLMLADLVGLGASTPVPVQQGNGSPRPGAVRVTSANTPQEPERQPPAGSRSRI